nr:MAG TPA: hypothetical protein [Caudoviricetes sp.]DAR83166.1 MAG TPA: hypothetical protein [Caudoviricetes sp.]DAY87710.1 MAG TPA: hypothetical protein [Caudoviricetes sp.]
MKNSFIYFIISHDVIKYKYLIDWTRKRGDFSLPRWV